MIRVESRVGCLPSESLLTESWSYVLQGWTVAGTYQNHDVTVRSRGSG